MKKNLQLVSWRPRQGAQGEPGVGTEGAPPERLPSLPSTPACSELTLSHIGVWASGEWECSVSTVQGNASRKVEIVVLETSASYCPAERVANNRGDFRLAQFRCPLPALCPSEAAGDLGVPLLSHPLPESAVSKKPL